MDWMVGHGWRGGPGQVEGMDKTHRPKIWEEFYNIFLERLASNDGASFLAQLAENKR